MAFFGIKSSEYSVQVTPKTVFFVLKATVPLKGKLTVSTRSSKLDSRIAKVETFEFRDARIEARESRVENRESRKMDFGICINSRRPRQSDLSRRNEQLR